MPLIARVWWCCCGVLCCLGGWWGPLVDVDDAPGDFDAVGVMVCGVAVSTLGWGPGGWRWWRLFASRGGVLGVDVDGGALGLCAGVVVVVIGVLWVTVPRFVVGGVGCGVSRGGLVAWVLLVLVLGGLRVGVRWFRACRSWLVFGRLVVLVVSVVPGVGISPSAVLGSVVTGFASVAV